ncbi:hypothetical protein [Actinospica sp.]|jgi:hypothetical protein|uniref:hypothetical protein n=1 Tax=Actinospica sp. TaxID=1872142 RepID=UPI002BC1B646|nr:hypothetical protein [Actinospica sp.]HWG27320.1 hypothetical protein [Actinospica sp.]
MDRLAAHVIATAALTVTLATVPVLFADASHAATIPATANTAVAPHASPAPCADRHQVGETRHEIYDGITAFSIKEFYSPSCHALYGYSYAWLQFRNLHVRYDVGMAVYDVTHGAIDGARTFIGGIGGPDFWSTPVHLAPKTCYQGEGHYFYYPPNAPGGFIEGDTRSTPVCA